MKMKIPKFEQKRWEEFVQRHPQVAGGHLPPGEGSACLTQTGACAEERWRGGEVEKGIEGQRARDMGRVQKGSVSAVPEIVVVSACVGVGVRVCVRVRAPVCLCACDFIYV